MNKDKMKKMLIPTFVLALLISGCQSSFLTNMDDKGPASTLNVLSNKGEDAAHLAAINEVLDASVEKCPYYKRYGLCRCVITTWTVCKSETINGDKIGKNGSNA